MLIKNNLFEDSIRISKEFQKTFQSVILFPDIIKIADFW